MLIESLNIPLTTLQIKLQFKEQKLFCIALQYFRLTLFCNCLKLVALFFKEKIDRLHRFCAKINMDVRQKYVKNHTAIFFLNFYFRIVIYVLLQWAKVYWKDSFGTVTLAILRLITWKKNLVWRNIVHGSWACTYPCSCSEHNRFSLATPIKFGNFGPYFILFMPTIIVTSCSVHALFMPSSCMFMAWTGYEQRL